MWLVVKWQTNLLNMHCQNFVGPEPIIGITRTAVSTEVTLLWSKEHHSYFHVVFFSFVFYYY